MGPGNRDSICVVGIIEVLRKARYLPQWYTTMWKLKELKEMYLAEDKVLSRRNDAMNNWHISAPDCNLWKHVQQMHI
ncbi:hypothetical protein TNCV_4329551 [Trichonephila clavipes]|nr:hypothetical protein TNCV_4329551 [Trichonephila clavipes]